MIKIFLKTSYYYDSTNLALICEWKEMALLILQKRWLFYSFICYFIVAMSFVSMTGTL